MRVHWDEEVQGTEEVDRQHGVPFGALSSETI